MSGIFIRCPNCDLEVKVEVTYKIKPHGGDLQLLPDLTLLEQHARNCAEENG